MLSQIIVRSHVTRMKAVVVALLIVVCVGVTPLNANAYSIEEPIFLANGQEQSFSGYFASPTFVSHPRTGTAVYVRSKQLCSFVKHVRGRGAKAVVQSQIRMEGIVILVNQGWCSMYEKALVAEMLGAEAVLTHVPYISGTDLYSHHSIDPPLEIPVEMVQVNVFDMLRSVAEDENVDLVLSFGTEVGLQYFM